MAECEWVAGGGAGGTSFKLLSLLYSTSTTWDCLVFTIIASLDLLICCPPFILLDNVVYCIAGLNCVYLSFRQRHNAIL